MMDKYTVALLILLPLFAFSLGILIGAGQITDHPPASADVVSIDMATRSCMLTADKRVLVCYRVERIK